MAEGLSGKKVGQKLFPANYFNSSANIRLLPPAVHQIFVSETKMNFYEKENNQP